MNEYKIVKITDLGTVNRGKSKHRPRNDPILYGGEYPFIQTGDVKKANLHLVDYTQTYNDVGLKQSKLWKKGTLCFTIAANIADSAILGMDACFPDSIVGFLPYENVSDTTYVKYLFDELKLYFQQISKGTTQDNLSLDKICRVKLRVLDYDTQVKVASILATYDTAIENNNKRIHLLEQMAESLYKEWFVRFRFPGYENAEFENGVPKGWEWQMLVDVTKLLQRGISPIYDDSGIYTVISQKCIRGKTMDISEARKQIKDYKEMLNLQDEDTVICSTGTGTLGRVGKVIGEYPNTTFDSHVTLARAKNGIGKQFLYGSIKNLQPWFMNMGIGSTNQQELYISLIRKTKILMPTDDLQQKFEDIVKPLHDEIGLIIKKNKYLIRQRDMLLPRLMSGKLEV